jgi:hypothetical protein
VDELTRLLESFLTRELLQEYDEPATQLFQRLISDKPDDVLLGVLELEQLVLAQLDALADMFELVDLLPRLMLMPLGGAMPEEQDFTQTALVANVEGKSVVGRTMSGVYISNALSVGSNLFSLPVASFSSPQVVSAARPFTHHSYADYVYIYVHIYTVYVHSCPCR